MPTTFDTAFLDTMPANVAVQFLDRVAKSPDQRGLPLPRGRGLGVRHLEAGRRPGRARSRPACSRSASSPSSGSASPPAPATSGSWPTSRSCAPRGATTTVYPSTNAEDTAYILGDSECRVVFAEDDEQIAKLTAHRKSELPHLTQGRHLRRRRPTATGSSPSTTSPSSVRPTSPSTPTSSRRPPRRSPPDQLATLIYTSGTTGRPKGVRLRHKSWVYEGEAIRVQNILDENDLQFLWLPMAHSFGKVLLSAQLACGFASAVDGRVDKIVDNCAAVKPTFMGAAPRIFEKAYGRIQTMQAAEGGAKEKIFNKAFEVGLKVEQLKREGKSVPLPLKLQHGLFDKLVFSKVRERFGGRVRFFISGAAALNREIAEWFNAAGIVILEGYGMTENSAGATRQPPRRQPDRHRRSGPAGRRGQDRRGRRGAAARPARHGRLPQPARGDRQGARRRRLAAHRRQGLASTPTASSPSPAGSRSSSRPPAASTSPRRRSSRSSRRSAPTPASSWSSATSATTSSRWSPSTPTRWPAGPPRTAWRARPTPRSSAATQVKAMVAGYVDELNTKPQPLGDHQEVGAARPRPHDRVRRAHPVDEGQAQRRRGQLQGRRSTRSTPDRAPGSGRLLTGDAQRRTGSNGCRWETTGTRSPFRHAQEPPMTARPPRTATTTRSTSTTSGLQHDLRHAARAAGSAGAGCSASSAGSGSPRWPGARTDGSATADDLRPSTRPRAAGGRRRPGAGGAMGGDSTVEVADGEIPEETAGPTRATGPTGPTC